MSFTLGNVFSGAFAVIRKHFVPLAIVTVLLSLLPGALVFGLQLAMGIHPGTMEGWQGNMVGVSLVSFLAVYVCMFSHASAVTDIAVRTADGRPVDVGGVIGRGFANALPVFFITLLCAIGWAFLSILIFIPALIFGTIFSIVVPAYVAEKKGVFAAFGRSRTLTKGHRWGIFGLWVLVLIIFYIVAGMVEMPILMPAIQEAMKAQAAGRQAVPQIPPLPLLALLMVVFSAMGVLLLCINASVYNTLRAQKDKYSGADVEKVFE